MPPRLPRKSNSGPARNLAVEEAVRVYLEREAQLVRPLVHPTLVVNAKTHALPGQNLLCNPAAGAFSVVLPVITRAVVGQLVTVTEVGGSFKAITVVPADGNTTICGETNMVIAGAYDSMTFQAVLPVRPDSGALWSIVWEKTSPAHGSLSVKGNADATTITLQSTYYQFEEFDRSSPSIGITQDLTEQHIEILIAGTYEVSVDGCAELSNGDELHLEVKINNGATAVDDAHVRATGRGAGAYVALTAHAEYALVVGDTVELWIENDTSNDNITVVDTTLSVGLIR